MKRLTKAVAVLIFLMSGLALIMGRDGFAQTPIDENIVSQIRYSSGGGFSSVKERGVIATQYKDRIELRRYRKSFSTSDSYDDTFQISKDQYDSLWSSLEAGGLWALKPRRIVGNDCTTVTFEVIRDLKIERIAEYCPTQPFQSVAKIFEDFSASFVRAGLPKEADRNLIIQSAADQAKALGYDVSQMDVFYDEGNQKAEKYFEDSGMPLHQNATLLGKNYQVVYFAPKQMQFGGDLWVFVDRDTGKVITHLGGK
ncbi:MAG: hypothetical protein HYT89_06605 [Candidatus Omnitrophica bacterium]|nr:hypothetical protein [Candidatus Omnitrophota bacterium]